MEKETIQSNGGKLLLQFFEKMGDFGAHTNAILKNEFFQISDNENFDKKIRDLATELMLYCEEDELSEFKMLSKEEIRKKIAIILQS